MIHLDKSMDFQGFVLTQVRLTVEKAQSLHDGRTSGFCIPQAATHACPRTFCHMLHLLAGQDACIWPGLRS